MIIYIGNLPPKTQEGQIRALFSTYGVVVSVHIISDQLTSQPKGWAYVEMQELTSSTMAIEALNNSTFLGSTIAVSEANPEKTNTSSPGTYTSQNGGYIRRF